MMDEWELSKIALTKKIAGDIVLSGCPNKTIKKWRNIFKISQRKLAGCMNVTPSVISDYESGRRKSPGIKIIKRIVETLLSVDEESGGKVIKHFSEMESKPPLSKALIDIKEFEEGVPAAKICDILKGKVVARGDLLNRSVYGYTIIDSLKAIVDFSFADLVKLYGITTDRALIFTGISSGRSPMVAIKVTNLRPGLVVLHGLKNMDEIAKRIAEVEDIPVVISKIEDANKIVEILKKRFR